MCRPLSLKAIFELTFYYPTDRVFGVSLDGARFQLYPTWKCAIQGISFMINVDDISRWLIQTIPLSAIEQPAS